MNSSTVSRCVDDKMPPMSTPSDHDLYYAKRPWLGRETDVGLHGAPAFWELEQPLEPYWLLFSYLRVSPSYELARQAVAAQEPPANAPDDFDQVLYTYRLFGDVHQNFFPVWWRECASKLYGTPHEYRGKGQALLKFARMKFDIDVLRRGARSLIARATKPESMGGYQLAACINPDDVHAKAVNLAKDAHWNKDDEEARSRRDLKTNLRRDLDRAERVAENAARGRFPTDAPVLMANFNYDDIGARLVTTYRWEQSQK